MAISRRSHSRSTVDRSRCGLQELRRRLLDLHKALIEAERLTYERVFGRVASTGELLQLVLNDPWFTWLHPLSQLVVRIDEALDSASDNDMTELQELAAEARRLLRPSEQGDVFARSYYELLQRSPDVVLAHSQVKPLLVTAPR